ncbi:MAG TPA: GntR family transcriptional regulator [Streptosporangiaceae bacterium]|jgi:DNA-binding GntR family transcriptional regulator
MSGLTPIPRGAPLRAEVYARVVGLVLDGAYGPGAALTEAALSRALDVSRTPVREALLRLEAEGVLESAPARGFTVRPLLAEEAAELYPILAALEALAVRTGAGSDAGLADRLDPVFAELASCADPVRRWRLDSAGHDALVAASGNRRLADHARRLRTTLSRYELAYMREVRSRQDADRQHREIAAALAAGESERAAVLVERHWHDGMATVLDWLARRPG